MDSGDTGTAASDSSAPGQTVSGKLYTWGLGKSGQLGTGKEQTEHIPQPIRLVCGGSKAAVPTQVSCGGLHTAVLTQDGDMAITGCGKYGRLASGDEESTSSFVRVVLPEKVKQISCGVWHGAAVTTSGGLLVWGHRKGCGTADHDSGTTRSNTVTPPTLLLSPKVKVRGVSCGYNFTLAWMEEDGQVMSWGSGHNGVLGHGDTEDVPSPCVVRALQGEVIVHASAGYSHSAFVTAAGRVWVCGKGKDGALGLGKGQLRDVTSPELVTFPDQVQVVQVSCSMGEHHGHTLALTSEGMVYSWGDGYKGKLGLGSQDSAFTPTLIPHSHFGDGESVSIVCAGGIHSAAATASGGVFTWGCGSDGRSGHPEGQGHRYLFRSDVPKRVETLTSKGKHAVVSCSYYHCAAIVG
ncbi:uncharacterized protein LOC143281177 [Babylonia areolata]|uniref:uncharacterized protein LOC143281177 n=1 Tax=Babylonia areolata TaxID=304850 RepID=UPI003FD38BDB